MKRTRRVLAQSVPGQPLVPGACDSQPHRSMRSFELPLLVLALLASGCSAFAPAPPGCVSRRIPSTASARPVSRIPAAALRLRMAGFGKPSEVRISASILALPQLIWALHSIPSWRQPRGRWMVSLVNSHVNASLKNWHSWEIGLRFALSPTSGWIWALHSIQLGDLCAGAFPREPPQPQTQTLSHYSSILDKM